MIKYSWTAGNTKSQNIKYAIKSSLLHDSAIASQPCPSGHITRRKGLRFALSKSRQVGTSFTPETLYGRPAQKGVLFT
jgi:hypothetical protein